MSHAPPQPVRDRADELLRELLLRLVAAGGKHGELAVEPPAPVNESVCYAVGFGWAVRQHGSIFHPWPLNKPAASKVANE